ncbi:MAG: hypothetical protein AAF327_15075, partial [Cyanobacteria bacterium P01_A01_bin.37]
GDVGCGAPHITVVVLDAVAYRYRAAKDVFHDAVKHALEKKEGWLIKSPAINKRNLLLSSDSSQTLPWAKPSQVMVGRSPHESARRLLFSIPINHQKSRCINHTESKTKSRDDAGNLTAIATYYDSQSQNCLICSRDMPTILMI